MEGMFHSCRALTELDLSNFNTSNVTNMADMFQECSCLTSLDLSSWNTSNVTDMNKMFHGCRALTELDISSFNTSNVYNMQSMFDNCSNLTTIYASNLWSTENIFDTFSHSMFYKCNKLKGDIAFDENYTDKTYAKIEGGYLTAFPPTLLPNNTWYKGTTAKNSITAIEFV